jgi:hypothetical protein
MALVALVMASACGGEKADDADSADAGASGGTGVSLFTDACSVITKAEVEQQFGDQGSVSDVREHDAECLWRVGTDPHNGLVQLFGMPIPDEQSLADAVSGGGRFHVESVAVEVEGAPNGEALEGVDGSIFFRAQGRLVSVSASFTPEVEGRREKLIALAEHALRRL